MKTFWTKRLPATLLALILTASLAPAAAAQEPSGGHGAVSAWSSNTQTHWHECSSSGCAERFDEAAHIPPNVWTSLGDRGHAKSCTACGFTLETAPHDLPTTPTRTVPATCYQDGKDVYVCLADGCGYTQESRIPATGRHAAAAGWSYSDTAHWHACTAASGCPTHLNEANHNYASGVYENNASQHWQNCTICDGTSARSAHTDSNGDGVCDVCSRGGMPVSNLTVTFMNGSSTFATQTGIIKGGRPTAPATPTMSASNRTYTFKGWTTSNPGSAAVFSGQTPLTSAQVASTALSASTTYYALYTVSASSQGVSTSVSGSSGVTVGSTLSTQISSVFNSITGHAFTSVSFSSVSGGSYGTLYANSSQTSLGSRSYSYSGGSYPLSSLYFQPSGSKGTYSVTYTAADSVGNTVSGTVSISTSASNVTTITYKVAAGEEVAFNRADFNDIFRQEYDSYSVRWVTFDTSDTLSSSSGTVYYDYQGSDERSFTKNNLDDFTFYYGDSDYGDYSLRDLSFVAGSSKRTVELSFRAYYSSSRYVDGTVRIEVSGTGASGTSITYEVAAGDSVDFERSDFNDVFQSEYEDYTLKYVTFESNSSLSTSNGTVYFDYEGSDEKAFTRNNIDDFLFYYKSSGDGDYALNSLSFVAGDDFDSKLTLKFRAYYSSSRYVDGTVVIQPAGSSSSAKGDITYEVEAGDQVDFDRSDFNDFFQEEYKDYSIKYVTFETDATFSNSVGYLYFDYDGDDEVSFTKSTIENYKFYYSSSSNGDYALNQLSFVAGSGFEKAISLDFRAYYSSSRYVDGTLVINPAGVSATGGKGDIRYYGTYNSNVQINANDIARFFQKSYPSATLQYVKLGNVPDTGTLYYNYYSVSKYGVASRLRLTSANCDDQNFYFSPSSTSQYALGELTYVPSGTNYCAEIPFTAYGGSRSVSGTILISVSLSAVSEVYGATPRGTAVTFPASAISLAVSSATGTSLSSIRLLELPASSAGTVYVGSGTSTRANTSTLYGASSGSQRINQLRFVPASGFTGSVEIPYVACNSSGKAIASGKFCLGVVSSVKTFSDVTSSTWCYKYVVELSDASVIDGYQDRSFRPNNTVTYGQALKLIMLAAGYKTQSPTGSHPFSGYLDKAKSDALISGTVNLDAPITRLAVAQIAAKAMKLDTSSLSSVQPFTDTSDRYVQALNAAGIVEGYFSNGTSAYRPSNTLTRGQISAIVWRMDQARNS